MGSSSIQLLNEINQAIIKFRGSYSRWSAAQGIRYNEMLVLYTIRDQGYCTQKQICDSYLLPPQTINHVISTMRRDGLLCQSPGQGTGREKAFVLTEKGQAYARPFLASLEQGESAALNRMGHEKLAALAHLLQEYDQALQEALEGRKEDPA